MHLLLLLATLVVHNDRVIVNESTIQPGETQVWSDAHPAATVWLTGGALEMQAQPGLTSSLKPPVRRQIKRGEVIFSPLGTMHVKNTGSSPMRCARIEFLGAGTTETWGNTGLTPNYVVLAENQYARVYDIHIAAGTKEPRHTHHDRVVVCLEGATLSHLFPDGREEPSTLKSGEIAWRRGSTHIGQNLGKTDLWVIAVEPK